MALSAALINIVNDIDSPDAQAYLRSEEALKKDSVIRKVIESGLSGLADLDYGEIAQIIFAALVLSGPTLELFKPAIKSLPDKDQKTVRLYLGSLLEKRLDFSFDYADWIAKHLHDLNENCSKLLEEKGKDSEWHVRLCVATHLDLDKDSKKLDRCVRS